MGPVQQLVSWGDFVRFSRVLQSKKTKALALFFCKMVDDECIENLSFIGMNPVYKGSFLISAIGFAQANRLYYNSNIAKILGNTCITAIAGRWLPGLSWMIDITAQPSSRLACCAAEQINRCGAKWWAAALPPCQLQPIERHT